MNFHSSNVAQRELAKTLVRYDLLLRESERLREDARQLEEILDGSAAPAEVSRSYQRMALRKFVEKTRGLLAIDALIDRVELELALLESCLEKEVACLGLPSSWLQSGEAAHC